MNSKQKTSKPKLIPIPKNIRFQLPLKDLCSIPTPDPEIQEEYEQNTNSLTEKDFNPDSQANASADTTARFKEMIIEELTVIRIVKQCTVHPEEDLEFYSFTKGRALCAECLVSGQYVGHEVINIKRAGEKIRKQFKEIVQETKDKVETYQKWERKAEGRREQLLDVMKQYRQDIKKRFEELQRKIIEKENEIMEGIDQIKIEKEWEFEAFLEMVKRRQAEVFTLQETLKGNLEDLDDVTVCSYYTKKEPFIRGFLKDTGNLEQKKVDVILERDLTYGGQWNLDKFEESFGIINGEVENMKGLEETKRKTETFRYEEANNTKLSQKALHLFAEWDQSSRRDTPSDARETPLKSHIVPAIGPLARRGCSISINPTARGENGGLLLKGKNDDIFGNYFDQIQKIRNRRNPSFSGADQALLTARIQSLSDKITVGAGASTARLLNTDRRGSRDPGRLLTESSRSGYGENSHIKGHKSQRERQPSLKHMMEEGSFKNAIVKGSYLPKGSTGDENVVSPVRTLFTRPETPVIKALQTYISSPVSPPNGNVLYEKMRSVQRKGSNLGN